MENMPLTTNLLEIHILFIIDSTRLTLSLVLHWSFLFCYFHLLRYYINYIKINWEVIHLHSHIQINYDNRN
jgi:hypothetical protein